MEVGGLGVREIELDDRYSEASGFHVVTGTQALLLSLIRQSRFDRARGLDTAGFMSGYRGSPLASLDSEAWRVQKHLDAANVKFVPGINEDLAMTAVSGTQHVALDPEAKVSGVFGMWYGKGAGLDRSGDALRHAHIAGSSRLGGVLVVVGDDHALKSSSQPYHSEPTFIDMQAPLLYPADIQEVLDYAILGWEMSRYSGCYVGLKVLAEHVNSTAIVDIGLERIALHTPQQLPEANDRWIRWPDPWADGEKRLNAVKLPAALDFARANGLNRVVASAKHKRLAIVTAGKSYSDLLQALDLAGLSLADAEAAGISILKIGMPWPADDGLLQTFCAGHETVLVIEEKRDLLERQVRSTLYGMAGSQHPIVLGRNNRIGEMLFPNVGELDAIAVLRALEAEARDLFSEEMRTRVDATLTDASRTSSQPVKPRSPYFCSGCPHSTSTVVPEGSRALAGVGCHFMATGMGRHTEMLPQMGGEGVSWIGTSPFTNANHVFVNLGEGTYYHSGILAIRAAVAANINATYKILFNDAIAMTGGQPVEGELTVPIIAAQLRAEGVGHIEVLAEDVEPYRDGRLKLPAGVPVSERSSLEDVQTRIREMPGVTAIIFDQVCATEKRRRRKRGKFPAAPRRVFINERVCEGCGDCSVKSNCLSVIPIETEFGRKRAIDQFSCNQDYSCVEGFCPSFVTVEGAQLRKAGKFTSKDEVAPPDPAIPDIGAGASFNVLVSGVGGTGIVTVGAMLGIAAHIEGKHFTIHDKLGMAQKYGAVNSHLRIADAADDLHGVRIADGQADLCLGGDLCVAGEAGNLAVVRSGKTSIFTATEHAADGAFVLDPNMDFGSALARKNIEEAAQSNAEFVPARHLALSELGDEIGANLLLVGFAWQKGKLPISRGAIYRAIELNGAAVDLNKAAFELGRRYAFDPGSLKPETDPARVSPDILNWDELTKRRAAFLVGYQNEKYAARFSGFVRQIADAERALPGEPGELAHAVAENYSKLLAYKDEYEVARLHTDGEFAEALKSAFESPEKVTFYLAPPLLGPKDKHGRPRKMRFGPGTVTLFRLLAKLKWLRGTWLDPFGYHPERKIERALITQYERDIPRLASRLTQDNYALAVELARLPQSIRGYGHIKQASIEKAEQRRLKILKGFEDAGPAPHFSEAAE